MNLDLVIVGAGGHARVVLDTLQAMGKKVSGFLDDREALWGTSLAGLPVLGSVELLSDVQQAVIAIGNNAIRQKIAHDHPHVEWICAVHPTAYVSPTARVGAGTVVFARAVVQPDARIGQHVIVNTASTVDHDSIIEDHVHLAPGCHLAGSVHVREGAFLGVGTCVIPGINIGAWSTVGAGATVTAPVPERQTVVGTPARPIKPKTQ
ncbi:acetyltransferase [Deinococcus misasensis]|uniref:acetyltransferase n=1 Tax=Deinococcus misasensis TaxID=392413 RepID=UPI000AC7ADC3|nr:acetyltransferase [Deinococcus misasensis]